MITAAASLVSTVAPSAAYTVRFPRVSLLMMLLFEPRVRNGPATAYQSVSPATSFGSGIPSVFQGTRPSSPGAQLPSLSKPSLSRSGHGNSPGRSFPVQVTQPPAFTTHVLPRFTVQPMSAVLTSASASVVLRSP